MKNLFAAILTLASLSIFAQPGGKNKEMKMTPEYSKGYYLNQKGDTVRGEVQNNMDHDYDYHNFFMFKLKGGGKGAEMTPKKAKGYGYDGNHYTILKMDQNDVYIKYLEMGRLNLLEWKYPGTGDDAGKTMSVYFIIDSRASADDKNGTNVLTQLNDKSHKKILKPFFKDQPIILEQVDKWFFKIDEVRKAVQEFNALYTN